MTIFQNLEGITYLTYEIEVKSIIAGPVIQDTNLIKAIRKMILKKNRKARVPSWKAVRFSKSSLILPWRMRVKKHRKLLKNKGIRIRYSCSESEKNILGKNKLFLVPFNLIPAARWKGVSRAYPKSWLMGILQTHFPRG